MVISFYPNLGWGFLLNPQQKKTAPAIARRFLIYLLFSLIALVYEG